VIAASLWFLVETRDDIAVSALLSLWARGIDGSDSELLGSLARQVAERRRQRERGTLAADCPDLSQRQLVLLRLKLRPYAAELATIAAERATRRPIRFRIGSDTVAISSSFR
jgi:hypothetical protein